MSDVSKTNEASDELRDAANAVAEMERAFVTSEWGTVVRKLDVMDMLRARADALEAATRVPVQGEPNDDREVLEHVRTTYARQRFMPNDDREAMLRRIESFDYDSDRVSDDLEQDIRALVAISRATVPDAATERVAELEAELASRIEDRDYWYGIADKVAAERDAATDVIAAVRVLHREEDHECVECSFEPMPDVGFRGVSVPFQCPTVAALDGAPEPEGVWEYGYELIEPDDRNVFEREGDFISSVFAYRAAKKRSG